MNQQDLDEIVENAEREVNINRLGFIGLFPNFEEYPDNLAETGIPKDTLYEYVAHSFLNGIVNYTEPIKGYLIERYNAFDRSKFQAVIDRLLRDRIGHPKLDDFGDDVVLLSETNNSYFTFYFDCDVSDCMVGRCQKRESLNRERVIELFDDWVEWMTIERDVNSAHEIPVEFFKRGWMSF